MIKKIFFCAFLAFGVTFLSHGQIKVTFKTGKIYPPKKQPFDLYIAGNFNGWNPAAPGWKMEKGKGAQNSLSANVTAGNYSFKVTRGSWQMAECSKLGKAIANREVKIIKDTTIMMDIEGWQDSFAEAEKQHTISKNVQIISEKFKMPQLGRERRVWIYLPEGYKTSGKNYPVIYMHDGQNLFDEYTAGFGEWGVDEMMDKVPADKQCIIVGIDHGNEHRITEYDPYNSEHGEGRGEAYVEFIVNTLKPYIDKNYPTEKDAAHTSIAGSSMGGLISMYAALKHHNVFGSAGVFSPAFWIAPDIYKLAEQQNLLTTRFYFVCGDAESETMVSDMQKMAAIIRSKGVTEPNSPTVIVAGARHNEKQWHDDFPAFYQWLMQK